MYSDNIRNNKGRYLGKFANRVRAFFLFIGILFFTFLVVSAIYTASHLDKAEAVSYTDIETEAKLLGHKYANDEITNKIAQLEQKVLDTLATCESGNNENSDGIIIFDSNNEASIGRFQWQRKSVIHYYNVLYGKTITKAEAIAISIDKEKITELTRDVLFTTENGWRNWYNCSKRHSLHEQVELINNLRD